MKHVCLLTKRYIIRIEILCLTNVFHDRILTEQFVVFSSQQTCKGEQSLREKDSVLFRCVINNWFVLSVASEKKLDKLWRWSIDRSSQSRILFPPTNWEGKEKERKKWLPSESVRFVELIVRATDNVCTENFELFHEEISPRKFWSHFDHLDLEKIFSSMKENWKVSFEAKKKMTKRIFTFSINRQLFFLFRLCSSRLSGRSTILCNELWWLKDRSVRLCEKNRGIVRSLKKVFSKLVWDCRSARTKFDSVQG